MCAHSKHHMRSYNCYIDVRNTTMFIVSLYCGNGLTSNNWLAARFYWFSHDAQVTTYTTMDTPSCVK